MKLRTYLLFYLVVSSVLLGCSTPLDYSYKVKSPKVEWLAAKELSVMPVPQQWWTTLNDESINRFVLNTLESNPTLLEATARIDEARFQTKEAAAGKMPTITANASAIRGDDGDAVATTSKVGMGISWELDLFGRIKSANLAAKNRLEAKTYEAASLRLLLVSQVVETVQKFRVCNYDLKRLDDEVVSRKQVMELLDLKMKAGFTADIELQSMTRDLANTRIQKAVTSESCERLMNALVSLIGIEKERIYESLKTDRIWQSAILPTPPPISPKISASVLSEHPTVQAANSIAEAAWNDVNYALADRYPKFNLTSMLAGEWLYAGKSTIDFTTWSAGILASAVIFDGGKNNANINSARARYQQSIAALETTVRSIVEDVENALAATLSAEQRVLHSKNSLHAANNVLRAYELRYQQGDFSLLELEDARRQRFVSISNNIAAQRDLSLAWIDLVKATGGAVNLHLNESLSEKL